MPQRFKVYDQLRPHFITSTVVYWIPVFCKEEYFRVLADSLRYCIDKRGLRLHAYVLMPNHFHLVGNQEDGDLSCVVRDVKRFTSRQITEMLEREGRTSWLAAMRRAAGGESEARLWDPGFHPEQVHSEPFCKQKTDYIHNNPVRAGYVNDPCEWRYSSAAAHFRGAEPLIPLAPIEW